ncbi:2OG-Fe(II) oxygenase [Flagellimonas nanhaiensis]|uniref:Prolyl 4-hydroxylase subunit alpha n=1 Tax=Flagellimonas nanhaiensis TaxID=2292706 RepID=A0A371JRM2_9FLAO|nr:2OG-Fe(II) oxygenase [Allomuricauda nanhaiensis]RDY60103.1 prolyl 4-hydroxylase subunit alpha [Allomuricauda nanhaiensis]
MSTIDGLNTHDWVSVQKEIYKKGYALVENVLNSNTCDQLIEGFQDSTLYRKTVEMERYRFGSGTYKYFKYPLPETISEIREFVYPKLVPIANQWMKDLKKDVIFPDSLAVLHQQCIDHGQLLATPLILKYGAGGYNTLHQDLYGEVYFPMQAVLFLNDYGPDYTGGEFVMTQQVPRAQSKAIVLHPPKGSMLIFTTNYRPIKGKKGFYRVSMRHGVSEVRSGERYTMGVIFHDATS